MNARIKTALALLVAGPAILAAGCDVDVSDQDAPPANGSESRTDVDVNTAPAEESAERPSASADVDVNAQSAQEPTENPDASADVDVDITEQQEAPAAGVPQAGESGDTSQELEYRRQSDQPADMDVQIEERQQ